MIKKLSLTKFGKFNDKEFPFSDVTVFIGDNEAGKSTIFDALFDNICNVGGNATYAKNLNNRYGAKGGKNPGRVSSLEFNDVEFEFSPEEFLNLYAVKSGEVISNLSSGDGWISKIQSSMFTGGIDPGVIKANLEYEASEKRTLTHMKKLASREMEKEKKQGKLKDILEEREKILKSENDINKFGTEYELLSKEISEKEKLFGKLKGAIELQDKIREKKKHYEIVKNIGILTENKNILKAMSNYEKDRSSEAEKIEEILQIAKQERVSSDAHVKEVTAGIAELERDTDALQSKANSMSMKIHPLNSLLDQIEKEQPKPIIRQIISWNKPIAVIGVCLSLGSAMAAAMLNYSPPGLAILAAGLIAGIVALSISRKVITKEENPDIEDFTRRMIKKWRDIVGADGNPVTVISELRETIIKFKAEFTQTQNTHKEKSQILQKKKDELRKSENELQALKDRQNEEESRMQKWLANMNVVDISHYKVKLVEYDSLKTKAREIELELHNEFEEYQCDNVASLKAKAETLSARLESETGGVKAIMDSELTRQKKEAEYLDLQIKELRGEEKSVAATVHKGAGQILGALGNLPEMILDLQQQIAGLNAEIRELDLSRRAAGFAENIFEEISHDSAMQFDIVSKDIAKRFKEFLPGIDSIKMNSFSNDDILVADGGGEFRPPEQLSTGTMDAFWFAARLSLAIKANPNGKGIIVLDEPFHAFDNDRMQKAIELLKKFYEDSKWQIVLFTWNGEVKDNMRKEFGKEITIHAI